VFGHVSTEREWDPETIFDVLGSELARRILALAEIKPCSADEFVDHTEASKPTVYRRLNVLQEYDLVTESRAIDDGGNHYKTYETNLDSIRFEVAEGSFEVDVQLTRDVIETETEVTEGDDHAGLVDDERDAADAQAPDDADGGE
jgi:DNA-binding transcriptional ArsR family regulator